MPACHRDHCLVLQTRPGQVAARNCRWEPISSGWATAGVYRRPSWVHHRSIAVAQRRPVQVVGCGLSTADSAGAGDPGQVSSTRSISVSTSRSGAMLTGAALQSLDPQIARVAAHLNCKTEDATGEPSVTPMRDHMADAPNKISSTRRAGAVSYPLSAWQSQRLAEPVSW